MTFRSPLPVRITLVASTPPCRGIRTICTFALAAVLALVAHLPTSTTRANTVKFTASVPISVISITVSPTTGTFGTCTGGSSTTRTLGFPDGECESPPITISDSGGTTRVYGSASNASAADGGAGWSLCVPFAVAGTSDCKNQSYARLEDGDAPGANQFALRDGVLNGGGGFIESTGTCLPGYTSATHFQCDDLSSTHSSEQVGLVLHGPELSTDDSSPFSVIVTFTAVPGTA
jgi:hypothetical protein